MNNTKRLLLLIPFLYLFILLFQKDPAMIGDLGRHIKMGEAIVTCLCVPQTNLFSFTHENFPIINHSWLSEVVFYLLANSFALSSLLVLKLLLLLTSFSIIYFIASKRSSLFWTVIFSLLSITIFATRFTVRPELFSYFFISLFILSFYLYEKKKQIFYLWFLPLIMSLWVNMHIYFLIGIALYGFFAFEKIVLEKKIHKQFLIIGLLIITATLLNPHFIEGAIYPLHIFSNYGLKIEENYPPRAFIGSTYVFAANFIAQIIIFFITAIFFLVGILGKPWKTGLRAWLSGWVGLVLGWSLVRCMALFSLLSLEGLVRSYTTLQESVKKQMGAPFVWSINTFVLIGVTMVVISQLHGIQEYKTAGMSFESYSEKSTDFFIQNNLKGPIFNNFMTGNFLIYKLYPAEQVFVDGRPEAFPAEFFTDYNRMLKEPEYFAQQADIYQINTIIFGLQDDPLLTRSFLQGVLSDTRWAPVFWDGSTAILVRHNEQNAEVIKKYRLVGNFSL